MGRSFEVAGRNIHKLTKKPRYFWVAGLASITPLPNIASSVGVYSINYSNYIEAYTRAAILGKIVVRSIHEGHSSDSSSLVPVLNSVHKDDKLVPTVTKKLQTILKRMQQLIATKNRNFQVKQTRFFVKMMRKGCQNDHSIHSILNVFFSMLCPNLCPKLSIT